MSRKATISSSWYSIVAGLRPATISQKTHAAMVADGGSAPPMSRGPTELQEHADQVRVELPGPGSLVDSPQRVLLVERGLVRALREEGVVDVDDRHETGEERHVVPADPI